MRTAARRVLLLLAGRRRQSDGVAGHTRSLPSHRSYLGHHRDQAWVLFRRWGRRQHPRRLRLRLT